VHGRIQGLLNFLGVPPVISGTGEATNVKFCMRIDVDLHRPKTPTSHNSDEWAVA